MGDTEYGSWNSQQLEGFIRREDMQNAAQARKKAEQIAKAEADTKSTALKKRRAALKESIPRLRKERVDAIESKFRDDIKYAVKSGKTKTEIRLSCDYHDNLRGMYKYLPTKTIPTHRGESGSYLHATGEGYLKYAAWGKYVKIVLNRLRKDGFKCEVIGMRIRHDDSAAYMNSGGECGSEEIYYTTDTILKISW